MLLAARADPRTKEYNPGGGNRLCQFLPLSARCGFFFFAASLFIQEAARVRNPSAEVIQPVQTSRSECSPSSIFMNRLNPKQDNPVTKNKRSKEEVVDSLSGIRRNYRLLNGECGRG